jgi:hypothetical protein
LRFLSRLHNLSSKLLGVCPTDLSSLCFNTGLLD